MKIAIGNDRKGLIYKNSIKTWLRERGHEVVDVGTNDDIPCDYPIYAEKVAREVASGKCDRGIVICSTGIGISIAANKVNGIRCGVAYNDEVTTLMREHNNVNMVSFGQSFMTMEEIENRLTIFLETEFIGSYHQERINLITDIERKEKNVK